MLYNLWIALATLAFTHLAFGAQIQVTVGGPNGLVYSPSTVNAQPGDVVIFIFMQKNHTATQSTFESPCQRETGGFDSGFFPVADNFTGPFPAAQYTVVDTNPVWVYCRQANHCQQGMVFAINPGDRFDAFRAAAMSSGGSASSVPPEASSSAPPQSSASQPAETSAPPPASTSAPPASTPPASSAPPSSSSAPSITSAAPAPSYSTPTTLSSDHRIVVGGAGALTFDPANITAQVGDTVTFEFRAKNHTVTQSTFAAPCVDLTDTSTSGQVGFDSGFMPVEAGVTSFPTFTVQINNTAPIWVFCRQANHCGQGMVFAVNAPASGGNTFDAFVARAKQLNGTDTAGGASNAASTIVPMGGYAGIVLLALVALLSVMA